MEQYIEPPCGQNSQRRPYNLGPLHLAASFFGQAPVFLALSLCFLLAACSTSVETLPDAPASPPDPAKIAPGIRNLAIAAKLQEPLEVSSPFRAPAISTFPWMICLRSAATEASRRITYSVFFKDNDDKNEPLNFRMSAIIEDCGVQPYSALK